MILNQERQIVFANDALLRALNIKSAKALFGLRLGEALHCAYAHESEGGCGTTDHCSTCGAVLAILAAQKGERTHEECSVMLESGDAVELAVNAAPVTIEDEQFTIFAVIDISHEKRRRMLERTFFHDILNTSTLLSGYAGLMRDLPPQKEREAVGIVLSTVHRLIDEIQSQQNLLAAENHELEPDFKEVHALEFINRLVDAYRRHHLMRDISIVVDAPSIDQSFQSDPVLLTRVLGNMLKNALEASTKGETVTIGCAAHEGDVDLYVHNEAVMPREVRLQIFMRSFSTKGPERGIGTYSMKLFTERYLGGKVSFTSEEGKGTTFTVSLPIG